MSKVYSFRLDKNNPREAQAREMIDSWVSKGYSLRHVVTEALLGLDNTEKCSFELSELVEKIKELISEPRENHPEKEALNNTLSPSFIESIKTSVKSGEVVK